MVPLRCFISVFDMEKECQLSHGKRVPDLLWQESAGLAFWHILRLQVDSLEKYTCSKIWTIPAQNLNYSDFPQGDQNINLNYLKAQILGRIRIDCAIYFIDCGKWLPVYFIKNQLVCSSVELSLQSPLFGPRAESIMQRSCAQRNKMTKMDFTWHAGASFGDHRLLGFLSRLSPTPD